MDIKYLRQRHRSEHQQAELSQKLSRYRYTQPSAHTPEPTASPCYVGYGTLRGGQHSSRHSVYGGWNSDSIHSIPLGSRGTEIRPYRASGVGRPLFEDEPLVPRPTFVTRVNSPLSKALSSSTSNITRACSPIGGRRPSALAAAHYSIPAQELYRDSVSAFPTGSPYHQLREFRSSSISNPLSRSPAPAAENAFYKPFDHTTSVPKRRPMSAHLNDDTFLAWSAETIVRAPFYAIHFIFSLHTLGSFF